MSEPTDEQLEHFVCALLMGEARRRRLDIDAVWGARMVMRNPVLKAHWLERHRELQEASRNDSGRQGQARIPQWMGN